MLTRGRPAGRMTKRRQQVLEQYRELVSGDGKVKLAELARRCGLYDYREARRVVSDLHKLGKLGKSGKSGNLCRI